MEDIYDDFFGLGIYEKSGEEKDMAKAIKQIINQCVLTENFSVNNLAMIDLEYLFLNIRGKAVGDIRYPIPNKDKILLFDSFDHLCSL